SCAACPLKAGCTPHDEGRRVYRPLAVWAETEAGRSHPGRPLRVAASTAAAALGGGLCWLGRPRAGRPVGGFRSAWRVGVRGLPLAFLSVVPLVVRELRWLCGAGDRPDAREGRGDAR